MKRFFAAILTLAMLMTFVACSDATPSLDDQTAVTSSDTTRIPAEPSADTSAATKAETSASTSAATSAATSSETTAQTSEQTDEPKTEGTDADTEPLPPAKVKVAIFTDPHSALIDTKVGTRRPSLSPVKIKKMMDKFVKMGVEYVICLGDFIENAYDDEENTEMLEMLMGIIRTYNIPFYTLMGNHDCDAFTKEEFYEITGLEGAPSKIRIGDALFVYLDANFLADGTPYEPGNIDWKSTLIPQAQLDFYENAWRNTDAKDVYVFMHQNIDTNIPKKDYWVSNAVQVQEALAECPNLRAVYQGHYHKGYNSVIGGVPYRTIPATCEGEDMPYVIIEV